MKFWKTIYWIVTCSIIIIVLVLMSSFFALPGSLRFYTVLSGSMQPTISTGSVVAVRPVRSTGTSAVNSVPNGSGQADYKVGDIITFSAGNKAQYPTTHRIIGIEEVNGVKNYLTKGDANDSPDMRSVSKENIIGKVLFDVPYLGYVMSVARTPYGFGALLIIPATTIIFDEVRKIMNEVNRIKREKKKTKVAETTE